MRRTAVITCTAILLCACTGGVHTLHVRPGDDPAAAIQKAVAHGGKTTIIIHGGDYQLKDALNISGAGRISIRAAKGERPVLRGDIPLQPVPDAHNKSIFRIDLATAGISDFGEATGKQNRFDLYLNGLRQIPARWPDSTYTRAGKVYGSGLPGPDTGTITADRAVFTDGVFECEAPRLTDWAAEKSGAIHAFARYDWFDTTHRILSLDGNVVHVDTTGIIYGFGDGFRFFAYNLLCEMDSPGEYHLDTGSGILSWYAPKGYDPVRDELSFSALNARSMLEIKDSEDVSIEGITFRGARNSAINILRSKGVRVSDCIIECVGGDGINVSNSKDVSVKGCRIEHCGHGGIRAIGGDRRKLEAAGYVFEHNLIRDFSELQYTYQAGIRFQGVGVIISGNEICECPSSALNLAGNDIYVENNYFHDLVKESDDQGALDIFGNYYYRGIVVRHNIWENITGRKDSQYGAAAVRLDDMICGVQITGNRFMNCGGNKFGAIQIHGGKDNFVENNVFEHCATGVSFAPWTEERWRDNTKGNVHNVTRFRDSVATGDPLYLQRYPPLKQEIVSNVNRNYILNNEFIGCSRIFFREFGNNVVEGNKIL